MKILLLILIPFGLLFAETDQQKIEQLDLLLQKQNQLRTQITAMDKKFERKDISQIEKEELHKKISALSNELDETNEHFKFVSSGVSTITIKEQKPKDLLKEFQDLLTPLLNAVKRISERPRKIEAYRFALKNLQDRNQKLKQGLIQITHLKSKVSKKMQTQLRNIEEELNTEISKTSLDEKQIQIELEKLIGPKESMLQVWSQTIATFFKTKGLNVLLAILTFFFIWIIFNRFKKYLLTMKIIDEKFPWANRPINVLYTALLIIFGTLSSILVLYLRHDWFLVTLSILFITGLLWSLKQWIPQFFDQAKILMNLGPIREGELVIWKSIPYKIVKLSWYSFLENPLLEGGMLRISINELSKLQSRPIVKKEPWFPSKVGDWIELKNKCYGMIEIQTPNQIVIKTIDGKQLYMKTPEYLENHPINYSNGFFLDQTLDLDYSLKEQMLDHILPTIKSRLEEEFNKLEMSFLKITTQVFELSEHSIKAFYRIEFNGDMAFKKDYLERKSQEILLHLCNEKGWTIPFHQLTVTMNK